MIEIGRNYRRFFHRPSRWVFLGLFLTAFALYLYQLNGQSVWRDEALSVIRARQPIAEIFANRNLVDGVESPDLHPPFYFLILHGWRLMVGESEFALRFPSLLFMLLALAMFHAVGKRIWGRESGYWAVVLAMLSPFFWWYAQEARMYALVVFESLLLLYTLWPLLFERVEWVNYLSCSLAAILLVFTHYSGLFPVLFGIAAYLASRWHHRIQWKLLIIPVLAGIIGLYLLYPHLDELLIVPEFFAFSQRPLLALVQEAINTFSLGSTIPMENPGWRLAPFISLAAVGALTLNINPRSRRWRAALVGIGGFVFPIVLFFAASWLKANYSNPRHLTAVSAPWYLLMGHGLATLRQRWRPLALLVAVGTLVAGGQSLYQTITHPPILKDDVRGLANYVGERMRPGDLLLWHNAVMMVAYDYYALDLPYDAIPPYGWFDETKVRQRLSELAPQYERIWFVDPPAPAYFEATVVRQWLKARLIQTEFATFPASWASLHLHLYQWPHTRTDLPQGALVADLQDGAYRIQGVVAEDTAVAGAGMWFSLWWSTQAAADGPPSVCLRLLDSAGISWSEGCASLAVPASQPPAGSLISQQLWLPLPTGLAPVPHHLELILGNATQQVGMLAISPSPASPNLKPVARFEGGLDLLDVQWASDTFRAGLWAVGNPVWHTSSPVGRDLHVHIRLADWLGRSMAEQTLALGPADYPSEVWQAGDTVRSFWGIPLPFEVNGRYRVQVSITDSDGTLLAAKGHRGSWSDVGWIRVDPWPLVTDLPQQVTQRPQEVIFGEAIRLAGYELLRDDDLLTVKLYWRNEKTPGGDYGVFVHVGQPGSTPVAQSSSGPANWTRPTTGWRDGEIIEDVHVIQLPPDVEAEELSIFAGLYDIDNPEIRVPVSAAGLEVLNNAFKLGDLPAKHREE